jgi:hypothetical protein
MPDAPPSLVEIRARKRPHVLKYEKPIVEVIAEAHGKNIKFSWKLTLTREIIKHDPLWGPRTTYELSFTTDPCTDGMWGGYEGQDEEKALKSFEIRKKECLEFDKYLLDSFDPCI